MKLLPLIFTTQYSHIKQKDPTGIACGVFLLERLLISYVFLP